MGHPLGLVQVYSNFNGTTDSWWEFPLVWEAPRFFLLERIQLGKKTSYLAWKLALQPQASGTRVVLTLSFYPSASAEKRYQDYLQSLQAAFQTSVALPQPPRRDDLDALLPLVQPWTPMHTKTICTHEQEVRLQALQLQTHARSAFWQVLEPDGTPAAYLPETAPLPAFFQSPKYGCRYALHPEQHLRLTLADQTAPEVNYTPFPETQPFRVAQFWLAAGQAYHFTPGLSGALRIASPTLPGHLHLRVAPRGQDRVEIEVNTQLEDPELPILAANGQCILKYSGQEAGAVFYVYQPYDTPEGLNAAQVLSCAEMMACFPGFQPPQEGWKISQQVFLAVALCTEQTVALADFQAWLSLMAQGWGGRLLAEGQETRLLIFPWAGSALRAALYLLHHIEELNQRCYFSFDLRVQMALHRGGVVWNGQQFSGPALRTVLQLLEQAPPQSLLFSRTLIMDQGFQRELAQYSHLKIYELHRQIHPTHQVPERVYGVWLEQSSNHFLMDA